MTNISKNVIAIDGTAASGKGTLARHIAETLNFAYLDTGKLYRYVGYSILSQGGDPADEEAAIRVAADLKNNFDPTNFDPRALQNPQLKSDEAGQAASKVAAIPAVRDCLLDYQRDFAQNPPNKTDGAVLDGRDIGTVICPNAPLKLYITAKVEIRAQRRYKELQLSSNSATYEAVLADMQERDARDTERETAPMKPADDAIVIDTSDMAIDEVRKTVLDHVANTLGI